MDVNGLLLSASVMAPSDPVDVTDNETMDVTFSCTYRDRLDPLPSVHWIFVSKSGDIMTLQQSDFTTNNATYETSHLRIKRANRTNAGSYKCVIENEFSRLSSLPAILMVNCKLQWCSCVLLCCLVHVLLIGQILME